MRFKINSRNSKYSFLMYKLEKKVIQVFSNNNTFVSIIHSYYNCGNIIAKSIVQAKIFQSFYKSILHWIVNLSHASFRTVIESRSYASLNAIDPS